MCINFNYYLLFILHAFTCTVAYFINNILREKKKKKVVVRQGIDITQ